MGVAIISSEEFAEPHACTLVRQKIIRSPDRSVRHINFFKYNQKKNSYLYFFLNKCENNVKKVHMQHRTHPTSK